MTKTNKELRSDFSKEMRDKFDKRNEQLNQIDALPIPEELKEQSRKAIMENFEKEMDEMKKRPGYDETTKTHVAEIKAKTGVRKAKAAKEELLKEYEEKLAKVDAEISDSEKAYKEAQIAHRGKVEEDLENSESFEIPQELKDFRKKWEEKMDIWVKKKVIIETTKSIPVKVETENDGSRLIEFKLGNKTYKILDPKLKTHSDDEYKYNPDYDSITHIDDTVLLEGMKGDDVNQRKNKKLAKYVKEKEKEGLHIAKIEEMEAILTEIGESAGLDRESDQIAMLMYLTGMDGWYQLSMGNNRSSGIEDSRSLLYCDDSNRFFYFNSDADFVSFCMIACN